jgi:hypothetical protein
MSDQAEKQDFITTVKELMRLTREGVLDWSVDYPSSVSPSPDFPFPDRLPTYRAEYENLTFIIEDARPDPHGFSSLIQSQKTVNEILNKEPKYILKIIDKEDSSVISSPPMKPIRDLASVIEKKPKEDKLEDINKRLSEIRD